MTKSVYIFGGSFLAIILVLASFACAAHMYMWRDYKIFAFLASDPTPKQIIDELGEPQERVRKEERLRVEGWSLPRVQRDGEVWIYSSRTGRRYYVYIETGKDHVMYVFSSSS